MHNYVVLFIAHLMMDTWISGNPRWICSFPPTSILATENNACRELKALITTCCLHEAVVYMYTVHVSTCKHCYDFCVQIFIKRM